MCTTGASPRQGQLFLFPWATVLCHSPPVVEPSGNCGMVALAHQHLTSSLRAGGSLMCLPVTGAEPTATKHFSSLVEGRTGLVWQQSQSCCGFAQEPLHQSRLSSMATHLLSSRCGFSYQCKCNGCPPSKLARPQNHPSRTKAESLSPLPKPSSQICSSFSYTEVTPALRVSHVIKLTHFF